MANLNFLARALTPCPLAAEFREPVSSCRVCGKDVLDLSVYTREEAARLLSTKEPPCVRFMLHEGVPVFRDALPVLREALITLGVGAGVALAVQTVRTAAGMDVPERPPHVQGMDFSLVGGRVSSGIWK